MSQNELNMSIEKLEGYEPVFPIGQTLLVQVIEPPKTASTKSGIIVNTDLLSTGADRPFLKVLRVSSDLEDTRICAGDIVEVFQSDRVSCFFNKSGDTVAIIKYDSVSGVYKFRG
jgi:hypothetical protein